MGVEPLAEAFPAGEFLAEELEERGWSSEEFATILGMPASVIADLISGRREISRETAARIGAALGTSAELWLNLQDAYFLWKQQRDAGTQSDLEAVRNRARLRELTDTRKSS